MHTDNKAACGGPSETNASPKGLEFLGPNDPEMLEIDILNTQGIRTKHNFLRPEVVW